MKGNSKALLLPCQMFELSEPHPSEVLGQMYAQPRIGATLTVAGSERFRSFSSQPEFTGRIS